MFDNIGILGLGLIGGSLARALKQYEYGAKIYGYNRNTQSAKEALEAGAIDVLVTEFEDFKDCDLIVLCCPVKINLILFEQLAPYIKDTCVITDVGSTKNDIYSAFISMNHKGFFIGGHPMAGSEKSGFSATKAELFENAYYILTPEPETPDHYITSMKEMIRLLRGIPVVLDSKEHDHIVAAISHVPHILASTLVNMVENLDTDNKEMYKLAAGGFRDFTRIAASSPDMWQQICLANKDEVMNILDIYQDMITDIKDSIVGLNGDKVYDFFDQSRTYRNTFQSKFKGSIEQPHGINVDIQDEPGSIATIVTHLAVNSINIKNIGINNNREDYEGVLEVLFFDSEDATKGAKLIKALNYNVVDR